MQAPRYVQVVHSLAGRTRLRLRWLRGDPETAARVVNAVGALPGVRRATFSRRSGTLLCEYDPERAGPEALVGLVRETTGVDLVIAPGDPPPAPPRASDELGSAVAREMKDFFRAVDDRVRANTDGRLDLGTMATLSLLGLGALDVVVNQELPLPRWFNLAWWSFRTFVTFERDAVAIDTE